MNDSFIKKYDPGNIFRDWLSQYSLNEWLINSLGFIVDLMALALFLFIIDLLSRKIFLGLIHRLVKRTKATWDDYFYNERVFVNAAHLLPAIMARQIVPFIFDEFSKGFHQTLISIIDIYIIVLIAIVISKFLKAIENLSESNDNSFSYPQMRSLSQVFRIILAFITAIFIISILFDIKFGSLMGGLAGTTAILILIFQDTINGLLANIQINMYDLVKKGDWITFNKFGVDGNVLSIDLTTVKVQNWDRTISSVPARSFVQDSFVNWRGMEETNARRIKRNILIDINSIKLADDAFIEKMEHIQLISDYVKNTENNIGTYNKKHATHSVSLINGRRQTNVGIYRKYIIEYLQNHDKIDQGLTLMVRQLQPTPEGVPIEVYCFANDIKWVNYENIQSDIFDHLYSATSFFDLNLYQAPSGKSFESLAKSQND